MIHFEHPQILWFLLLIPLFVGVWIWLILRNKKRLEQFADSIGTTIYFDSLYTNAIRISHQWFAAKSSAEFSVKETDNILERFCDGKYMPLSSITEFATFPNASYPWSEYLLEQYVAYFSEKFYLLHGNYNKNCVVGAIVRKTFPATLRCCKEAAP